MSYPIEKIFGIHTLPLNAEIISGVSEIYLDIRSFEMAFEFNGATDELFPQQDN